MNLKIILTPIGHYFLGGERNFTFDSGIRRQYSEGYFIHSKEIPSQTTLFGTLRYLLGVKDEKLIPGADKVIGPESFNIVGDSQSFGKIHRISPVYLMKDHRGGSEYFTRAPLDHNEAARHTGQYRYYCPLAEFEEAETYRFPEPSVRERADIVKGYDAKSGTFHGWMSTVQQRLIPDTDIFTRSVEVVSNKEKKMAQKNDDDALAKKEFVRMQKQYHFVFFTDVDDCDFPEHTTAVIGKGSSVFDVRISKSGEEQEIQNNIRRIFRDRPEDFIYCASDCYVADGIDSVYDKSGAAIVETETMRIFETTGGRLHPVKDGAMINLIRAGSILYCRDRGCLENRHAKVAGLNNIVTGGFKG